MNIIDKSSIITAESKSKTYLLKRQCHRWTESTS